MAVRLKNTTANLSLGTNDWDAWQVPQGAKDD